MYICTKFKIMDKKLEILKKQIVHSIKNSKWVLEEDTMPDKSTFINESGNIKIVYKNDNHWNKNTSGYYCKYTISIKSGNHWSLDYNAKIYGFSRIGMFFLRMLLNMRSVTKAKMIYLREMESDMRLLSQDTESFLSENKQFMRDNTIDNILK